MNNIENLNIKSKKLFLFLDTPKLEFKGIYGKHRAHSFENKHRARSFENMILLITEIKYFTSFYQDRIF